MSTLLGREHDGMGVVTKYHREDEKLVIETVQDVAPYLERNLKERNEGVNNKGDLRKAASIPNVVVEMWMREGVNVYNKDHWPKVLQKLKSPEWAYLRTGAL